MEENIEEIEVEDEEKAEKLRIIEILAESFRCSYWNII